MALFVGMMGGAGMPAGFTAFSGDGREGQQVRALSLVAPESLAAGPQQLHGALLLNLCIE